MEGNERKQPGFDYSFKTFKGYTINKSREPIVCDRNVTVLAVGGKVLRSYFRHKLMKEMVLSHNQEKNKEWALNFGATENEANEFALLTYEQDIWDRVSAWMTRMGLVQFQPWIARDVATKMQSMNQVIGNVPYDAIHVRRGDKIIFEAKAEIRAYWEERGVPYSKGKFIPFSHYLQQFNVTMLDPFCGGDNGTRKVYVATMTPKLVKSEINEMILPNNSHVKVGQCNTMLDFEFYPESSDATHIKNVESCGEKYQVNIATLVELTLLTRSSMFIGEYNSNWGRLLRILRTTYNQTSSKPMTKDLRVAWGPTEAEPPGM
jgi:hypothetical protein